MKENPWRVANLITCLQMKSLWVPFCPKRVPSSFETILAMCQASKLQLRQVGVSEDDVMTEITPCPSNSLLTSIYGPLGKMGRLLAGPAGRVVH